MKTAQHFFHLDRNKYLTSSGGLPTFVRERKLLKDFLIKLLKLLWNR